MLVDQLTDQPGQAIGRQPVIQRRRQRQPLIRVDPAKILRCTRLRPPEMRVSALSQSYLGQSTITELIRPIIPHTMSSADDLSGVLPTQIQGYHAT